MICIGNQTACWAATAVEPFEYALAHGFDAFEWFPDKKPGAGWDEGDLDDRARKNICEKAKARDMRLSVHARWQVNLLSDDGYPLVWKDLELARDLGAELLNVHFFHERGTAAFIHAIIPLMRRTAEAGLQLAIENTPHHSPEQFNELFACLRGLESPETSHVGMCLDIGHANLCSATRNDYLGFCDRLDARVPIIHLHLHENWGDADTHLPLFTGPASQDDSGIRGLLVRLKQRDFSGSAILEQWPHPPSLLNHARDKLLQLWNANPDEPKRMASSESVDGRDPAMPSAPIEDFAAELVAGNERSRSWREKLDVVRGLLLREEPALAADQLSDIAVYLQFLGTGQIACSEDGRHFRPAHHARMASQIQERLAQLRTPDNSFILRKIYPWLPSSSPAFQRPEPLTRVRDIAHRNDIASDLKREIKSRLQNKLHRCAGPEDLVTSAELLERITRPGADYSPGFVEQFKIFHEELQEFFNARSLDARLAALASSVNPAEAALIEQFLRQKVGRSFADRTATLRTLTQLREAFLKSIERNPVRENQEFFLADIGLEEFAFVLLSEIISAFETLEPEDTCEPMEALILALKNLALSGVDPAEAKALETEFQTWGPISPSFTRDELLRMKATMLRCRRLAEDFSTRTIAVFSKRAEKLGRAMGVADHAIRMFAESNIRAHIIFQVSKLATDLLRRIRQWLGMQGWEVLVSGRAVGRAKTVDSLDQLQQELEEPVVVLLKHAAGDEEIPQRVTSIALAHELPHLSHLAVRARQAGVILVTCEELSEFERLQSSDGQLVSLSALPDKFDWATVAGPVHASTQPQQPSPRLPTFQRIPQSPWIPLEDALPEICGGKAAGARRLADLSRLRQADFRTPPAIVVPFGVMGSQLDTAPGVAAEYRHLSDRLDGMPPEEFAAVTERLREVVHRVEVPEAIISEVARQFAPNSRLAVRSSANCEDMEEFAGAGLYDSAMNVAPADVAAAIQTVWSSLWTSRAALSRRKTRIPHHQAQMAVLIQEMIIPDFSFVLHTVNPITHRMEEVYAEIVVGLGDTLASAATRGSPYRLVCDKHSGAVRTLAFANFSQASRPNCGGGLRRETVDYSRVHLSQDANVRQSFGRRLAAIGQFVEQGLGGPQDIEGVLTGDRIYLVQARPQAGTPPGTQST